MKHHEYILIALSLCITSFALPIALADDLSSATSTGVYSIQTSPPKPTNVCTEACLQPQATPKCPADCPTSCIYQQSTDPCCPDSMEAVCADNVSTGSTATVTQSISGPISTIPSSLVAASSSASSSLSPMDSSSASQSSATIHNNAASTDMKSNHALYITTALVAIIFAALLH
ncbi:hypothetical protein NQZ79_g2263 [Umbelopsis isabellina]|nr:hypothetical protein NQZ79_g2263 [Umbelopsis isabellina]